MDSYVRTAIRTSMAYSVDVRLLKVYHWEGRKVTTAQYLELLSDCTTQFSVLLSFPFSVSKGPSPVRISTLSRIRSLTFRLCATFDASVHFSSRLREGLTTSVLESLSLTNSLNHNQHARPSDCRVKSAAIWSSVTCLSACYLGVRF